MEDFTASETRRVARRIGELLVENTPKLSGWAASRWRLVLGSSRAGLAKKPPDSELPGAVQQSYSEQRQSFSAVSGLRRKVQEPIRVVSDCEYINKLNQGSSSQAPAGFVESSVDQALLETVF
jgi:hypothetical protein